MAKFKSKLTSDVKHWKRTERALKAISKKEIEYGWLENKTHGGVTGFGHYTNLSIPHVAALNEYGHNGVGIWSNTPARPYFRNAIHTTDDWMPDSAKGLFLSALMADGSWRESLKVVGGDLVDSVKYSILKQNEKPLSDMTVKLKDSSVQLIDSGTVFENVKYKIINKTV